MPPPSKEELSSRLDEMFHIINEIGILPGDPASRLYTCLKSFQGDIWRWWWSADDAQRVYDLIGWLKRWDALTSHDSPFRLPPAQQALVEDSGEVWMDWMRDTEERIREIVRRDYDHR